MNKQVKLNRKLLRAVKTNSCDLIEPLLRQGADPLANNCRTLEAAIERGRVSILEKFLQHKIKITETGMDWLTIAVRCRQLETLDFLLNRTLSFPSYVAAACLEAIRNDWGQAMAMLLDEGVQFDFSPVQECVEYDSVACLETLSQRAQFQPIQAARIVEACVKHLARKILKFILQNFPPGTHVLNGLLMLAACERSPEVLEIHINHGATGQDESTEAFIKALSESQWIPAAELLLPHVNIDYIDDRDLANLARWCEYDLVKQLLRRGMRRPVYELDPMFATDFVPLIDPKDFFVLDDGLTITKAFLEERLLFCGDLAQAAKVYVKHYENDDIDKRFKIASWLIRCIEIERGMKKSAQQA